MGLGEDIVAYNADKGRGQTPMSTADGRPYGMNIGPDQIRAQIDALLARLPDPGDQQNVENGPQELKLAELEEIARRLSEAHDVLLQALESAEKG
jgi:hypothetical protein